MLEILNLKAAYQPIKSGTKIKYMYTSPNKYGIECIGFNERLPKEFGIMVDTEEMFAKLVAPCITRLYSCLNWSLPDVKRQYQTDFLEMFAL